MDGLELANVLKADPATAAITLFLLSPSGQRLGEAESHMRGFAGSLTKPVRQSELFDCLMTGLSASVPIAPTVIDPTTEPDELEVIGGILLVEHNKMNQRVGSKVLAKLGYHADLANHGREAVAAIEAGRYDAVLMDC